MHVLLHHVKCAYPFTNRAIAMYTKGSFGRLSTDIELLLMFDVLPI